MSHVNLIHKCCLIVLMSLLVGSASPSCLWASPPQGGELPQVVAQVDGQAVTLQELEAFTGEALEELDRQRHKILEAGLQQLVEQRLLTVAAGRQGVEVEALVLEATRSGSTEVTQTDIDAWYEANQQRVRQPKEAVEDQIRSFLQHQRQQEARSALLEELRGQIPVVTFLEPRRAAIDLAAAPSKGSATAAVTLVEFSDFQCPYCQRINPVLDDVLASYGDQVRLVFMQFPLTSIHPQAFKAAEAALCANAQGEFWSMHDALFAQPKKLAPSDLEQRGNDLGLDMTAFSTCLDSGEMSPEVRRQVAAGRAAGVSGTPTFLVNGRLLELQGGQPPGEQITAMIDDELARLAE